MDDDYEELGFHHLDTLLHPRQVRPGILLPGGFLPGVDLTLWLQLGLVLVLVCGLALALL